METNVRYYGNKRTPCAHPGHSHHRVGNVDVVQCSAVLDLVGVNNESVALTECELAAVCKGKSNSEDSLNIFSENKKKGGGQPTECSPDSRV